MVLTPEQEAELAARYEAARPDVTQTLLLAQANAIREAFIAELEAVAVKAPNKSTQSKTEGVL